MTTRAETSHRTGRPFLALVAVMVVVVVLAARATRVSASGSAAPGDGLGDGFVQELQGAYDGG